jgi:hypothetical protein
MANRQVIMTWLAWVKQGQAANQWRGADLNRQPRAYESPALPLSYLANSLPMIICQFALASRRPTCFILPDL